MSAVRSYAFCRLCTRHFGRSGWTALRRLGEHESVYEVYEIRECPCGAEIAKRKCLTERGEAATLEANLVESIAIAVAANQEG